MKIKKITSRQKDIIQMIAENHSDKPITISQIASRLDLSTRTVLRDMSSIEQWLEQNDFQFIKKPGKGLILNESLENKKYIIELLHEEKVAREYSKKERKILILSKLLTAREPLKSYYFIKLLRVSEGTLNNDFTVVSDWLEEFNIKLIRKQGLGCCLEGNEKDFRNAYINLIYESYEEKEIIDMVRNIGKNIKPNSTIEFSSQDRLLNLIDKSIINKVEATLTKEIKELNLNLSDSSYIGLVVHISLAIQRIKNGEKIVMDTDILDELRMLEQFNFAQKIAKSISSEFKLDIPLDEIGYITMHIKGSKLRLSNRNNNFELDDMEIMSITKKLIKLGETEFNISLKHDKRLLNDLMNHLGPSLCRMKMDMVIRNPILEQIKSEYNDIFKGIEKIIVFIQDKMDIKEIPESEIAYIAMHFESAIERNLLMETNINAVISCPTGIGTSRFLQTKLENKYPNLTVLETISSLKIDENYLKNKSVDLIISTVELSTDVDYIFISPFLNYDDEKIIKKEILRIAREKATKLKQEEKTVVTVVKEETSSVSQTDMFNLMILGKEGIEYLQNIKYIENGKSSNLEELIRLSGNIFGDTENHKEKIINDLQKRVNISSPYVEEIDMMLLHCSTEGVENIKSAIIRLENEIDLEDNQKCKYVFLMLIPTQAKDYQREILSSISKKLIEDMDFVNHVRFSKKEIVSEKINNIIFDFYKSKIKLLEI